MNDQLIMPEQVEVDSALFCTPTLTLRVDTEGADRFALLFKAIGHPVRVQILDLIAQGGGQICGCDIECHFDLTQPTISHHLKVLRDAGLISSEARGVSVFHRIRNDVFVEMQAVLQRLGNVESA